MIIRATCWVPSFIVVLSPDICFKLTAKYSIVAIHAVIKADKWDLFFTVINT